MSSVHTVSTHWTAIDVPPPWMGMLERWTCDRTGDAHHVLNVFVQTGPKTLVFVRTFHGANSGECIEEFENWVMAEYNTQVVG